MIWWKVVEEVVQNTLANILINCKSTHVSSQKSINNSILKTLHHVIVIPIEALGIVISDLHGSVISHTSNNHNPAFLLLTKCKVG